MDRSAKTIIACGILTSAIGMLPILVAAGIIAPAPAAHEDSAPAWLGVLFGLVFVAGGVAVVMQGLSGDGNPNGELPQSKPLWLRAIYALLILTIIAGLGAIETWVAFGPGDRHCSGSISLFGTFGVGNSICRGVFGFGAVMVWLILIVVAVFSVRRLRSRA